MQDSSTCSFRRFLLRFLFPTVGMTLLLAFGIGTAFERYIILGTNQADAGKLDRFLKSEDPFEIPIFGSSRALGSYVPGEIDSHCFNYGYVSTGNSLMLYLLRLELQKKRETPIIMNLDCQGFDYAPGNLNKYISNIDNPVIREVVGEHYKWYYSVPVIKYYSIYDDLLAGYFSDKIQLTKFVQHGCAIEKNSNGLSKEAFQARARNLQYSSMFSYDEKQFGEILKLLSSTKRTVVFVIAPMYRTDLFMSRGFKQLFREMCQRLQALPNVKVYDFMDMTDDESDFFNISHVSLDGALKFSRRLHDRLKNDRVL